jgi:hypothetical protein
MCRSGRADRSLPDDFDDVALPSIFIPPRHPTQGGRLRHPILGRVTGSMRSTIFIMFLMPILLFIFFVDHFITLIDGVNQFGTDLYIS